MTIFWNNRKKMTKDFLAVISKILVDSGQSGPKFQNSKRELGRHMAF